jgi:hypothetical protein
VPAADRLVVLRRLAELLSFVIVALCQIPDNRRPRTMTRYYFDLKDGADLIQDLEGSDLASAEDARSRALKSARELWADAIKPGRPLGADAVVIADEHGGLTFVPMAEALPKRPGS